MQASTLREDLIVIRIGQREIDAVARVINSGALFRYSWDSDSVPETEQFEAEWAAKIGSEHVLATTSGTGALICACAGLGIGPGDEVIVPAYTFIASAIAPLMCGAIPVLADVNESLTLDPADLERHITPHTKAILPVHMQGLPCDMDGIMAVARKHNLVVIEDACQADAGSFKGRRLGTIGDMGCFSFNYFKIITCGEGGAVVTNDYAAYSRARMMQDGGIAFWPAKDKADIPNFIGLEFRFNNILAAILREQIQQVDDWLASGRAIKRRLTDGLAGVVGVAPSNDLDGDCGIAFPFNLPTEAETLRVQAALGACGVNAWRPYDTDRHVYSNWEPILEHRAWHCDAMNPFKHPANQDCQIHYTKDQMPRTLDILKRTLIISLTPFLTDAQVDAMIDGVRAAMLEKV